MDRQDGFIGTGLVQYAPGNATIDKSPTGQDYYVDAGAKNVTNITKFSLEAQFREMCPVWKAALPGSPSVFSDVTPM
jgi:hypothetical protein